MPSLKYSGCSNFRVRLCASTLSGKSIKIHDIRSDDYETPGLQDFEASFLRLLDKMTDGSNIEINETGTTLRYRPGILIGGKISHDCGTARCIGWFIEGILPMAMFCKLPLQLTLTGITNDSLDISVDILRHVTIPLLRNFGIEGCELKVRKRGCAPKGGGLVEFRCPVAKALRPVNITMSGQIRRVRGTVFCARVSPTVINRVIESAKSVLGHIVSDVYITADHFKGSEAGHSAGYSLSLIAESTTGALLSVERTAGQRGAAELPETIGQEGALMLLDEMCKGGVIDRTHQSLILQLLVLGPEDVCKVRFGVLTDNAIQTLRVMRDAFGVVFKIKREDGKSKSASTAAAQAAMVDDSMHEEGAEENQSNASVVPSVGKQCDETGTVLLSCLGIGFTNMSRKII